MPLNNHLPKHLRTLNLLLPSWFSLLQALWTRFFPLYADIKNLIDSNALGELRMAFVSFGKNEDNIVRMQDPDQGGGAIVDLGIYCLHIVDMMFGGEEPLSITAVGQKTAAGVDSTTVVTMFYKGNKMASLTISMGEFDKNCKSSIEPPSLLVPLSFLISPSPIWK